MIKNILDRYKWFLLLLLFNFALLILAPDLGKSSFQNSWENVLQMLMILPPIFILLGLLDVWVKRETIIKYMGENSGIIGIILAFVLGSAAAGPLYAAFPLVLVLLKKGCKFSNVLIMLGAWSTTKIPMLLFEATSMGLKFTLLRLGMNIIGIALIGYLTEKLLSDSEREDIYQKALEQG